jgi:transposase InsO family protein
LTATWTGQGQAAVFVAVDHRSAECVGIHAAVRATRFEALEPIRQGVRRNFGAFGKDVARGLAVRHDHGSQYMAHDFQKELAFLGIASSPAFVWAPEGNGCAERFIRTLKENLLWVHTFETIEDLRQALLAFREAYNTTWLIERHGFMTPAAARQKQLQPAAMAA